MFDNRTTVVVGCREYVIVGSNLAVKIYAEQMGDEVAPPWTGNMVEDIVTEDYSATLAGVKFPTWYQLPHNLMAIWAMARAAGSVRVSYEKFCQRLDRAPSPLWEAVQAVDHIGPDSEFGKSTFFRDFPLGAGADGAPNQEHRGGAD